MGKTTPAYLQGGLVARRQPGCRSVAIRTAMQDVNPDKDVKLNNNMKNEKKWSIVTLFSSKMYISKHLKPTVYVLGCSFHKYDVSHQNCDHL